MTTMLNCLTVTLVGDKLRVKLSCCSAGGNVPMLVYEIMFDGFKEKNAKE